MEEHDKGLLPVSTPRETAFDIAATVSSVIPWVGGPVSIVLSGMSISSKLDRIREVLLEMSREVSDVESDISKEYVKGEDFQELLEKTLRQAAGERSEEKRKNYAAFLANDIKSPGQPYDEKLRILRTLEEVQDDHIRMLRALLQKPGRASGTIGSISQTLKERLPDMSSERISDLAQQLTDMRLATLESLNTMMTGDGAQQLQSRITPYGNRFISYISSSE